MSPYTFTRAVVCNFNQVAETVEAPEPTAITIREAIS